MSTDSNRMANNFTTATSNNVFVSPSHEQFIPKRMKKANLFVKTLGVLALILSSVVGVKAQTLIAEYPFNNTLAPSTGSFGNAVLGTATLGATSVCTDNFNDYAGGLKTPFINTLSLTSFQVDFTINLTSLPSVSYAPIFIIDGGTRYFGLLLNQTGQIKVLYNNQYQTGVATGITLTTGTNYDIQVQYINGQTRLKVNNQVYLNATLPALSGSEKILYLGDHNGAPSPSAAINGCYSNLKIYNNPTPFPFTAVSATPASLSGFSSCLGSASTAQTTSVSGTALTADMVLTAQTGYEISTDNSTYSSTVTLPYGSGTVAATTIYVRLTASAAAGAANGNLTITSTGATTQNVALTGTVNALPTLQAITGTLSVCPSATTQLSNAQSGGTWTSSNTAVATVNSTGLVTGVSAGSTTITYSYTDGNGCVNLETATVTVNSAISSVTIAAQLRPCTPTANGSMLATVTGGSGPFTYQWQRASTQFGTYTNYAALPSGTNPTNLISGWYRLVVTGSCGSLTSSSVQLQSAISVSINSTPTVTYNSCSSGTVTLVVSGGIGTTKTATLTNTANNSLTYSATPSSSSAGNFTIIISNVPLGTYSLTVTEQGSACSTSGANVSLTALSASISNSALISCYGGSNGSLTVIPSSGTSPYSYAWYVGQSASGTVIGTSATITGLAADYYTVEITDANSCTTTETIQLLQPDEIVPDGVASDAQCSTTNDGAISSVASLTTGGTGAYGYAWTASNGGTVPSGQATSPNLTGLAAGTYTVTVTDANSCTGINSFTINAPSAISFAGAVVSNVTCNGLGNGSITSNLSGANTPYSSYTWSASNGGVIPSGQGSTADLTSLVPGSYTLTVVDGNTCSFTSSAYTITQPTLISATLSTTTTSPICQNGSNPTLTFSGSGDSGVEPYTFTYTLNGGSNQTLSTTGSNTSADISIPTSSGGSFVYNLVSVEDNTGCIVNISGQSRTFTILSTPTVVDPSDIVACGNQTVAAVTLSGTSATSYTWTNSSTTVGLAASGTANSGNQFKIPSFTASNTQLTQSSTVTVTPVNTSGGTSCSGSPESYSITINQTPVIANGTTTICSGETFTFTPGGSSVVPSGTTYTWTVSNANVTGESNVGGNSFFSSSNTLNQNFNTWAYLNGSYFNEWIQTYVAPNSGSLISLQIPMYAWVAATTDNILVDILDENNNLLGTTTTPLTSNGSTQWLPSATFSFTGVTLTAGNVFKFRVYTANGNTIQVNMKYGNAGQYAPQTVSFGGNSYTNQQIFFIGTINASGVSNISQTLTNTTNTAQNVVYTVTPSANGCSGSSFTVTVTVNPTPSIQTQTAAICSGAAFTNAPTNGSGNIVPSATTYTWSVVNNTNVTGESAQATAQSSISQTLLNVTSGPEVVAYTVTPTKGSCVGVPYALNVTVNPLPNISAGSDDVVCNGSTVTFTATSTDNPLPTITWNNGITDGTSFVSSNNTTSNNTTLYIVTAIDATTSCTNSDTVQLVVIPTPTVNQQSNIVYCGGITQPEITFTGTTSNTQYAWTSSQDVGFSSSGTATPTIGSYHIDPLIQVVSNVSVTPQIVSGGTTCPGTAMTFTVTANPTPTVNAVSSQTVCNGSTTSLLTFSGNQQSATYNWTNDNSSIGLVSSGSGDITSFTATNSGTSVEVATIGVTPVLGSCSGTPLTTTITVNPTPTVTDPTDQPLCAGSTTNQVNFTGVVPGTLYSWINDTPSIGLAASGYGTIPAFTATNSTASAVTGTVTVTPNFVPAVGTSAGDMQEGQTLSLTAPSGMVFTSVQFASYGNPTGTAPNYVQGSEHVANTVAIIEQAALGNSTFTISVDDTNFPNNFGNSSTLAVVLTYGALNTACPGTAQTFTYTVNPVPVFANQTATVCSGNALSVTPTGTTVPTGTQFTWTVVDNANVTGDVANATAASAFTATLTNTTNTAQTVVYTLTPISGACNGATFTLTVTVDPMPSVTAQTTTICSGSNFTVTPTNGSGNMVPSGTTYSWSAPTVTGITGTTSGSSASSVSGSLVNTTNAPINVTYTVTPEVSTPAPAIGSSYGGGQVGYILQPSDPGYVAGQITMLIVNQISSNALWGCQGQDVTGANGTAIGTGAANTAAILAACNTSGIAAALCDDYAGGGFTDWYLPSRDELASMYCSNCASQPYSTLGFNSGEYWSSTNFDANSSYYVYFPAQIYATNRPKDNPGWTISVIAMRTATMSSTACTGAPFTVTVTVNPMPTIAAKTTSICSGSTFTVTPTNGSDIVPANTTYTWSAPSVAGITGTAAGSGATSISGTLTNTTNAPIDVTYTVTPVSGSCTGSTFTVTVTVFPTPALSSSLTPAAICSEETFNYTATSNTVAASGSTVLTWSRALVNGIFESADTGTGHVSEVLTNTTNAPIDVTYVYTITSNGCSATNQVVVTVNPTPTVDAITSQTLCSTDASTAVVFASTFDVAGTSYSWTNSNQAIGLAQASGSGNISSFTAANNTNASISSTIVVTPTANGCDGIDETFTITVNPTPTVDPIQGQTVCNGATVQATQFTSAFGVAGTTYDWVSSNTSIGIAASGNGDIASFTAVNNTNAPVTATITVTPSATFGGAATPLQGSGLSGNETIGTIYSVSITGATNGNVWGSGTYTWDSDIARAAIHNGSIAANATGTVYIQIVAGLNSYTSSTANGITTQSYGLFGPAFIFVSQPQGTPSSCTGDSETFTITVNPTPTVNPITSQVVCENTSTTTVTFASTLNVANTTYAWTNTNTNIGLLASGTGNIAAFTTINSTNAVETATIVVTPSANGCNGSTQTFTIAVNPRPDFADQASEICSGSSMSIDESVVGDIVPNGTQYTWTASSANVTGESSQATASSAPSQQLANTVSNITNVTYLITPLYTSQSVTCTGSPFNAVVSVSPEILVGNETVDVCSGAAFLVTPLDGVNGNEVPTGIDYTWSAPSSASLNGEASGSYESNITGTLFNLTSSTVDVTYLVTPSFDMPGGQTCNGSDFNVTVSVLTGAPTVNVSAASYSICSNDSVLVDATTIEALFGTWSTSGNGTFTPNVTNEDVYYHPTAADLANGSVNLSFTATNACGTSSNSVSIALIAPPTVAAITGTTAVCLGGTAQLSSATSGGTWSSSNTAVATVDANGFVTAVSAGTTVISYSITGNGCSNIATTNFTVNGLPQTSISSIGSTQICSGGSLTLLAPTGSGYTYQWNESGSAISGATSSTLLVNSAGSYTVTVTDAIGCNATTGTPTVVTVAPSITVTVNSPSICTGGTATLTASGASTYLWSTGETTASISVSPTSNISYTVTGTSGTCSGSAVSNVTVNALPVVAAITGASTVCEGLNTQLSSATTGGTWTSSNTAVATVSSTGLVSGLTAGNTIITYTVSNGNNCSTSVSASVTVNAGTTATITAGGATTFCSGSSVTLTATAGSSYLWSNGAQTQAITVTAGGSYYVTVTNASGCSATSSATTVTVNSLPTVSAGADATICSGSSASLTATGASTYAWSPSTGLSATNTAAVTANPTATTTYTVTGTDANGCVNTDQVTVSVVSAPSATITASATTICTGSSVTLSANAGSGNTYSWSNGTSVVGTTQSIVVSPTATTSYTVTVTNSTGCSTTSSATTVTVNSLPTATITASAASVCAGSSATLTASAGTSYLWNTGATTASITVSPTSATSYSVTVTNANGCSATSAVTTIGVNALPTVAAITGATNVCSGLTTQLASATAGGTWTSSNTAVATVSSTGVVTGVTAGSVTISYSVTDGNGCSNAVTATVNVNAGTTATITAGGATTFCSGGSVTLTANSGSSYLWSNGAQTQAITVTAGGSYYVTVTNASGCSATSTSTAVTVNAVPTANILANGPLTFCQGGSVTLTASPIVSGDTYAWSNGGTTSSITVSSSATVTLTVTSAAGCSVTSLPVAVNVFANPTATITAGGATTFCAGGSVTLTANAGTGYTYQWSNNTNNQAAVITASGSYTVTVTDANGCSVTSAPTVVTVTPLPTVAAITGSTSVCTGSTSQLASATTGGTWSSSNTSVATVSSTGLITGVAAGSATITYTVTSGGCTNSTTTAVVVNSLPTATVTTIGSTTICQGGFVNLVGPSAPAGSSYTYVWNLNGSAISGATASSYTATTPGSYTLTVTSNSGCVATSAATTVIQSQLDWANTQWPANGSICEGGSFNIYGQVFEPGVTPGVGQGAGITAQFGYSTQNSDPSTWTNWLNASFNTQAGNNDEYTGVISGLTAGTYYYAFRYSLNGCTYQYGGYNAGGGGFWDGTTNTNGTLNVIAAPTLSANIGPNSVCTGNTAQMSNSTTGGVWSSSNPAVATISASGLVTGISVGSTVISYTFTNSVGCSSTVTGLLNVNGGVTAAITAGGPTTFCQGGSVTLTASTGSSYLWSNGAQTQAITVTDGGSYYVTVTNGCASTSPSTTVTVSPLPTANILANGPLTFCQGGSVTLSASPVVAGNTYLWSNGATTPTISVTSSETVTLAITNAAGCSVTSLPTAVNVFTNPTATITVTGSTTFCQGGSVLLTANAGTGYSYQWSNNTNNQTTTVSTAGSYTVTVTDANGCSVTSAPTVVTVNPLPATAAITGTSSVCIGGTTLLSTTATNPVWSSANTAVATVAANGLVTGVNAGTVVVSYTITNSNGCTNTASVTVTVNQLPTAAIATVGATTFCQGGSVTLLASNAPAGMTYTYQWNLNGTAITGATANTYVANATGNYSVTITNNTGCSATSAATSVTVNALPVLAANTGVTSVCENGTVTLSNAQVGGLWSTANNTVATINSVTGVVTGINPGTTTLTYTFTNANGCTNAVSTNFTVNALPSAVITANGPTVFCQGGSVTLTASAGTTYAWSNGATTQSITVNNTQDISVIVTNANGCSATSAITSVVVNALPVANISSLNGNTFCQGGSVTLVASPGALYAWSNGLFTQSVTVNSTQTLTVTVTNADGCSATSAPFTVTMSPAPVATITANGPTTFCAGGSVTLTAPSAAAYLWSSGELTQSIVASVDGPYSVIITDGNGCTATSANTNITVLAVPSVQAIAGANAVCEGATTTLTNATIGGTWSSSNTNVATIAANGELTGIAAGSATITYTVSNANGCTNAVSTVLNVNAAPVLTAISGTAAVCVGSTTTLANAQAGGTWSSSNVGIATVAANGVVSGLTAGSANITYTYTNASGCTSSVSQAMVVNALPVATITANGPTTFCPGGSVVLSATPGMVAYAWSTGAPTATITASNATDYVVTVIDANGCSASSAPMAVNHFALPVATINSTGSVACLGTTVTLTATGGASYAWNNGPATASINVTAANTYTVTVTSTEGCTATASETVTFNANPAVTVTANGPTVFCQGGSLTLTATGGSTYVWNNGDQGASTTVNQSGAYYVTATNAAGCTTQSAIVNVTVNATPVVAAISGNNSVCEGGNMILSSATPGGIWSSANNFIATIDGAGNVTGLNAGTTTMTYTVSNNGCSASVVAQVNVLNNPATPTITASGATSVCPGSSVVLFASNAANYQWSNGPQTPFIVATQSGAYTVTVTGLNGCSTTSAPVTVFIGDNTAPVMTAPLNVTVTPNLGCEAIGVSLGTPVTSDNCSVASVTNDAPAIFPIGVTTVTWTAVDGAGNTTTATQLVIVVDQSAPTVTAPANVTVSSNNFCEATGVDLGTPNATDNCTNNLTITNNAPATYPLGTTTVTWTVTDAAGNITTVDQTVTVIDETAPVVLLASTSVILDANGSATIDFSDIDNGSFDNCGIASVVISQTDFDCSNTGTNTVSVTITDNNGNQTTGIVSVVVVASDACGGDVWSGPSVPDAFTPNGNNFNDTWVIPGLEGYNNKEMTVYSRYGTLVHYSSQYNNDWDGTLLNSGTPVPDGTYYYILNLDGGKQLNGYVYINRVKQ